MSIKKLLALRIWNRMARAQKRIQKLMIQKADSLGICLLSIEMMTVMREHEKVAIAKILPDIRPMVGRMSDYALLYLDLPKAGIAAGFYRLQLAEDRDEAILPIGALADENDQFVRTVHYHELDVFAALGTPKNAPKTKFPVFETFNVSNDNYFIGGTLGDGKAFLIRI